MRPGLERIPSQGDLERAYADLGDDPAPDALARYAQWSRFDPRLAEIWVATLLREWKRVHPIELREALLKQPWPAAAGQAIGKEQRASFRQGDGNSVSVTLSARAGTVPSPIMSWPKNRKVLFCFWLSRID